MNQRKIQEENFDPNIFPDGMLLQNSYSLVAGIQHL